MLNEIISGISRRLNAIFGDGYEIYRDDVEQGLTEPCFFIAVLKPELSPLIGSRKLKRNFFDIHYFPRRTGDNAEMFDVAEQLMSGLEYISMPDGLPLRGTAMSYETIDGVLHFYVSFNMVVIRPKEENPMETLATNIGTKKG